MKAPGLSMSGLGDSIEEEIQRVWHLVSIVSKTCLGLFA